MGQWMKPGLEPTESPTLKEIYWAAGYLDGEGSFYKANCAGQVRATSTDDEPLEKLRRWFGGSISGQKCYPSSR
ncbi:unnamed protein product, partial [marine sediment metagenome]